eukprot:7339135-Prymnesium_polylepis.3
MQPSACNHVPWWAQLSKPRAWRPARPHPPTAADRTPGGVLRPSPRRRGGNGLPGRAYTGARGPPSPTCPTTRSFPRGGADHRVGIQNAPAGAPPAITDNRGKPFTYGRFRSRTCHAVRARRARVLRSA